MKTSLLVMLAVSAYAQSNDLFQIQQGRPIVDAHNCYPYEGKWTDRIQRALSLGYPVGIEQDLAWYAGVGGRGSVVVTHTAKTTGSEPTLREHFFERVRPLVEKSLRENDRSKWPLIVVHFDVKDNSQPLLRAVWELLGEYHCNRAARAFRCSGSPCRGRASLEAGVNLMMRHEFQVTLVHPRTPHYQTNPRTENSPFFYYFRCSGCSPGTPRLTRFTVYNAFFQLITLKSIKHSAPPAAQMLGLNQKI